MNTLITSGWSQRDDLMMREYENICGDFAPDASVTQATRRCSKVWICFKRKIETDVNLVLG